MVAKNEAPLPRLTRGQLLGYGVGDLGINLNFQLIGFYLAYFYTDIFGLKAAHVAGLFLAARLWDGLNDPLMGWIADRTQTRWGRLRPYLLFGALPLNLALVAAFFVPDLGYMGRLVYAYVTYILHGMLFTAVGLPYSSLTALLTDDQHERASISSTRMFFAVIIALGIVSAGVKPLVNLFDSEREGFLAVAMMFAAVSTGLLLLSFKSTKERVTSIPEHYSLSEAWRLIRKNDALLSLAAAMFCNTCVWVMNSAVAIYYFKYVLKNEDFHSQFFLYMIPANLLAVMAAPALCRRYGKLRVFLVASIAITVLWGARHFVVGALIPFVVLSLVSSFAQMLCGVAQWAMVPDTVEYAEHKLGRRSEGLPYAFFSFTQKCGMAIGGAFATFILGQVGYIAGAEQNEGTLTAIRALFNLIPAGFSLLCALALLTYRLRPEIYETMLKELRATRLQKKAIASLCCFALLAAPTLACQPKQEATVPTASTEKEAAPPIVPEQGSVLTGKFRNLFAERGHSPKEVEARINQSFQQLFHGDSANESVYFDAGENAEGPLAYILDTGHTDVRSEGISYGMMIAVQLDRQPEFDALWNWANAFMLNQDGPAQGYFAWQLKPSGEPIDNMPAPDGEEYLVTALYFAANRWGSDTSRPSIYNYKNEADSLLARLIHREDIEGTTVKGNNTVGTTLFNVKEKQVRFTPDTSNFKTNSDHTDPSYHLPAFYRLWAAWGPEEDRAYWREATTISRDFLVRTTHRDTALAPDYAAFDGSPVAASWDANTAHFRWDAWRTAMNWSMDCALFGEDPRQVQLSNTLQKFFSKAPQGSTYQLDGTPLDNNLGAGLVAMNAVASLCATQPEAWLFVDALWEQPTPSGQWRYYDGLLHLFALLHVSGEFKVHGTLK